MQWKFRQVNTYDCINYGSWCKDYLKRIKKTFFNFRHMLNLDCIITYDCIWCRKTSQFTVSIISIKINCIFFLALLVFILPFSSEVSWSSFQFIIFASIAIYLICSWMLNLFFIILHFFSLSLYFILFPFSFCC